MQTEVTTTDQAENFTTHILNSRNPKPVKINNMRYDIKAFKHNIFTAVHTNKKDPDKQHVLIMSGDTFTHMFMFGKIKINTLSEYAHFGVYDKDIKIQNALSYDNNFDKNYIKEHISNKICYLV